MKLTPASLTVVMLGLVGLLVVGYVAKQIIAKEELVLPEETVNIPMALTDLEPGTVITEAHIGLGPALVSKLDREVLQTQRVVVGRVVKNPIERAQPIRTSDLYAIGERPPLDLSPGMRAVSVGLGDGTSLVDGLIAPGQYVDVLFTPATTANMRGGMVMSLFKGVKVLAINRNLTAAPSLTARMNVVTLELTPEQSNVLVLARDKGDINLTYNPNGPGDGSVAVADENRAYLDEILGLALPAGADPPFVTEIYLGVGRRTHSFGANGRYDVDENGGRQTMDGDAGALDLESPGSGTRALPSNPAYGSDPAFSRGGGG